MPPCDKPILTDLTAILVYTLQTHHRVGCDLDRTAVALGIHPSTARYRLYRIRELTELNPADPEALHALHHITGT